MTGDFTLRGVRPRDGADHRDRDHGRQRRVDAADPGEFAIGVDIKAFPFALAMSFAIRTPLPTPAEDQLELVVSGPAIYNGIDFIRDGAPP